MPGDVLESISSVTIKRSYLPGRHIIIQGRPCQSVNLILKGKVNVFLTSIDGRTQVLARLGPGNWLNVVPCLKSIDVNPAGVVALTPVKTLAMTCSDLQRLLEKHPGLTRAVLSDLVDHVRHLWGVVEKLALLSTRGRVARFILEHADEDGFIQWRCTQEDIAARLGTVQDVVGRALRGFADAGLIEMPTRHCIVVRDYAKLKVESKR